MTKGVLQSKNLLLLGSLMTTGSLAHATSVGPWNIITTVVGTGATGNTGDNGPAISATLNKPYSMVFDASGNMYIANYVSNRIRKVDTHGIITLITTASGPKGLGIDSNNNLYIPQNDGASILKLQPDGTSSTFAGRGAQGSSGDNGPATSASAMKYPSATSPSNPSPKPIMPSRKNTATAKQAPMPSTTTSNPKPHAS